MLYIIIDKETKKQTCSGIWSKDIGEAMILSFKIRQAKGKRPDISKEMVDNLILQEWTNGRD